MEQSSSPGSRTRLVVASQALEIQHLQDLVKSRENELQEFHNRLNEERHKAAETIQALEAKNQRLDSQIQLLASKLRESETAKETQLGEEVSMMVSMTQTGRERDSLIAQLREELKVSRNQNASLLQEREIILEKLVVERNKTTSLEAQVKSTGRDSQGLNDTHTTLSTASRGVQTGETTTLTSDDVLESGEKGVEALRDQIELEQNLLNFHQNCQTVHATNIAELHERLQRKLQQEVRKLQDEQDKYAKLMTSYGTLRNNNMTSPAPSQVKSSNASQLRAATPSRTHGTPPPATSADQSCLLGVATPASSLHSQPTSSPFFQQQEEEMANLRKRLVDLQSRHQESSSTSYGDASFHSSRVGAGEAHKQEKYTTIGRSSSSSVLERMLQNATSQR